MEEQKPTRTRKGRKDADLSGKRKRAGRIKKLINKKNKKRDGTKTDREYDDDYLNEERYDDESEDDTDQQHQQNDPQIDYEELDRQIAQKVKKRFVFKTDNHPHDKGSLKYNF